MQLPYIQHNRPHKVAYLFFDVDHPEAAAAANDAHLPQPTLIVVNPDNGHAHLGYELTHPVTYGQGNPRPLRYLETLERAYTAQLGADRGYAGLLTKNPLHSRWRTYTADVAYDLPYLADWVDLKPHWRAPANDTSALGRNCTLFEDGRRFAYREVHQHNNETSFAEAVLAWAIQRNAQFTDALPFSEVRATARSIAKWTWRNRLSIGRHHRLLNLNPLLPLSERQRIGAEYTNSKRKEQTEARLIQAIGELTAKGEHVTKAAVARQAGLSRYAVSRDYQHLFEHLEGTPK